ncbi:5'-3' exoribonuclease 1-like isoform X2 [Bolinopsis microptera]|uniref:5'-3' exoribonuclease 1-like isoform X2 n=1 Tax=Bolinopsis microptera TaxID=2820187 RepID=UPI00307932E4
MGVPKFYRWISERYPCLSQVIKEYQIPEFDNIYLDMNGIIHPCSHPNDEDAHFRISEQEIFQNIFNYIECLFRLIKPKKLFFMAVDGVAPRAKMNQQRARRFRSAMDVEQQMKDAIAKGETLPSEDKFDSNCITPGTEFMCKLHEQLKYFINKKMSSDPAWQKVKVVLSGHNVPGEGEHKIMEYIRYTKQQPDYDPETRHCLYGLDADLILLGLVTHEVHFSLLREEVKFGKAQKRITSADEQCFHLLHLSLFREYIDKEFHCLKEALGDAYDLERIIDDFVLLTFLVGNDFIPHLPDFHIHAGSLPTLWQTYKDVRPSLDDYLHLNGEMNMKHLGTYLEVLSRFDLERFEVQYEDLKWMAGKAEERKSKTDKQSETDRLKEKFGAMMMVDSEGETEDSEEEVDMLQNEFKTQKKRYYMDKFELTEKAVPDFQKEIGLKYVEGLKWILTYYYQGCQSWSWFYPYHYAPYLSDLSNVAEMNIDLDLSEPFCPFQQLMAVFPYGSSKLLPTALQELYREDSPIADFYPRTFKTDLNGKKQEWEAVVLISFINEERLVDAMSAPLSRMTDDEKARNKHGDCLIGTFDPNNTSLYPSSYPGVFPDLKPSYTNMEFRDKACFLIPPDQLTWIFPDKAVDPFRMGFPTSTHLKHEIEFAQAGCKIFQFGSKDKNCILNIDPQSETPLERYTALLGEEVYVQYPHLVEAMVVGVHTEEHDYVLEDSCVSKSAAVQNKKDCFKHLKSRECIALKSRWGIEVGDVRVMICVRKIRGKVPSFKSEGDVTIIKHWCEEKSYVPAQLVLSNLSTPVPVQEKCENLSLSGVFPKDAKVFVVSNPGYGSLGTVEGSQDNRVKVRIILSDEPMLETFRKTIDSHDEDWYFPREMCSELHISPLLLSKITSAFKINIANKNGSGTTPINIGLNIKYANKSLMAPDYARKIDNGGWQYSEALYTIIKEYVVKFPELFKELEHHLKKETINASEIAQKLGPEFNVRQYFEDVKKWLKSLSTHNSKLVGVGSEIMSTKHVAQLLADIAEHKKTVSVHELVVKVKPRVLFNPNFQNGVLPPDAKADFQLCDRVVNVCSSHCVPFGYKGTIVGIKNGEIQSADAIKYEVLFDEPFIGGLSYGECNSHLYTMLPFTLMNFSYGMRLTQPQSERTIPKPKRKEEPYHNQRDRGDRGDRRPPNKSNERKEILRKNDHDKGRKPGPRDRDRDSGPKKQQGPPPPRKGAPPRKKNVSVDDMSEDDHLNYRENQWGMPRVRMGPDPYGAPPPPPPHGAFYGQQAYSPASPTYPPNYPAAPAFYANPRLPQQYSYPSYPGAVPAFTPGPTSPYGYIPGHSPMYPAFPQSPVYNPAGFQYGMGYNPHQPGQYYPPQQGGYTASGNEHSDRANGKPRNKQERKKADTEYDEQFYHGEFYQASSDTAPKPPKSGGDPHLEQPGKPKPKQKYSVSPGGTHYYQ